MRILDRAPELPRFPRDRPVGLLIRHAERPPIPEGKLGMELSITENGVAAAQALGDQLGPSIISLRTSAVRRCVQTSQAILRGAGLDLEPIVDPKLGVPSTFAITSPEAETTIRRLGMEGLMEHFINGEGILPGLPDPEVGASLLREHVLAELTDRPGLHLFVTHDAMVASVVARSWKVKLEPARWPVFLESAAIWREGAEVLVSYRDQAERVR